jgi:hypothetical protein
LFRRMWVPRCRSSNGTWRTRDFSLLRKIKM